MGAPASAALLGIEGLGLQGWQWLFVIQGLPAVVLGFVVLRVLTNNPEEAERLTPDEKAWLVGTLAAERRFRETKQTSRLRDAF